MLFEEFLNEINVMGVDDYGINKTKKYLHGSRDRLSHQLSQLEKIATQFNSKSFLSVGGYPGFTAYCLKKMGLKSAILDHPLTLSEKTEKFYNSLGLLSYSCDLANIDKNSTIEKYGVVECCQCIEHWNFPPFKALKNLLGITEDAFYLTVPNSLSLYNRLTIFLGLRSPFPNIYQLFRHYEGHNDTDIHWMEYTINDLNLMLKKLEIEHFQTFSFQPIYKKQFLRKFYSLFAYYFPGIRDNLAGLVYLKKK